MTNPFLDRIAKKGTTGHGNQSEKRVAGSLAARLQPASGAMAGAKGDFKSVGKLKIRYEAKSTTAHVLKVELAWLTKIAREALSDGSIPALTISFVKADGTPQSSRNADWVAVPSVYFKELIEGK